MPLHLEVVCTEPRVFEQDRRGKIVRVIGEILPYVLAKYCGENSFSPDSDVPDSSEVPAGPDDFLSRFSSI